MQLIFETIEAMGGCYTIIDIACGNGELLKRLKAAGHQVTGVDISPIRVLLNRSNIGNYVFAFAEDIPLPSDYFDFIIAQECLEHVMNLEQVLKEMLRLLKPGGMVFSQAPNGTFADGVNHVRLFDINSLTHVFQAVGFEVMSKKLIPYLKLQEPNNIFLKAVKNR
jgi:2-polyprenyl-3-methyl-5-hydroxy-6-metoxy-1,4-benzoquinol methylase